MFGRLLPRETSFFDFFEQHAAVTLEGMRELKELVAEGANIQGRSKRILELEHEADVITHRCVEALHKTFITPMDRESIHELISRMDDVLDAAQAAAERITLYEITDMMPEARDFAAVLVRMAEGVEKAVKNLRRKQETEDALKICIEINRLENEADGLLRHGLARLFKEGYDALTVIKWKEILENLEEAADTCEDVANIIEGVILEGS
jgi:uncharacterized protein